MKRLVVLILGLMFCGLAFTPAHAQKLSDSAVITVYVNVDPHIQVTNKVASVYTGPIQTGNFDTSVSFGVSANMETVKFILEASDLYKGDDPVHVNIPPVAVDQSKAVQITPQLGGRTGGGPNEASWDGPGEKIGDYPTVKTVSVVFQSGQVGVYSQNVIFKVFYNQPDSVKPSGQYSGKLRLNAFLDVPSP